MKLLTVVVAYFPDLSEITENIKSYIAQSDKLIIWDNTPNQNPISFEPLKNIYGDKILIMSTGKNEGIGYALNRAAEWGLKNGYDLLMTMDQDSNFEEGSLTFFLQKIEQAKIENTFMFVPMVRQISGGTKTFNEDFRIIEKCMTSGAIHLLAVFTKIGFFREDLFIEGVDYEMCWRSKLYDLKILQVNNVWLKHVVGNRKEHILFGLKFHSFNYAPIRLYYSARNLTWLWLKYKKHKYYFKTYFYNWILKRSAAIILFEKDKIKKLYAINLGLLHGIIGKLGKRELY